MASPHVVILLATYQGARYLGVQLDSIAVQTHGDWSLVASDDGSTDATRQILDNFAARMPPGRVTVIEGPRAGATQNFLSLLRHVPPDALAAFCDQDDLWFPDKLKRAVEALGCHAGPAHYAARTIIADHHLNPLVPSRHFRRPLGFRNALVQACMAGNTSVFNAATVLLLQRAARHAQEAGVISHDWWAYQVTSGFGAALIHDPKPVLLYRQHATSEVGRNDTLPALAARLRKLMDGEFATWLRVNHSSLAPLASMMPADSQLALHHLDAVLKSKGPQAMLALRQARFYRQTSAATAALVLSALGGALRRS